MLDRQPTLSDDLLTLRPLGEADWDALYGVASDPLIWAGHPAHDRWQEPVFRRFFADAIAGKGALVALDNATGAMIGFSRYDQSRAEPDEVEIGWTFLARACWGGAHNRAMKALMVGHALQSVERVIFLVGETNRRSQRAMEKVGAVLTDRRQSFDMAGVAVVHLTYAIDKAAFKSGPLNPVIGVA